MDLLSCKYTSICRCLYVQVGIIYCNTQYPTSDPFNLKILMSRYNQLDLLYLELSENWIAFRRRNLTQSFQRSKTQTPSMKVCNQVGVEWGSFKETEWYIG